MIKMIDHKDQIMIKRHYDSQNHDACDADNDHDSVGKSITSIMTRTITIILTQMIVLVKIM
jgi:hypothetical protein